MKPESALRIPSIPADTPFERARIAVRCGQQTVDFGTLEARVQALEKDLRATTAGTVVGIRIGNEPAFLVAYLACLAAGRAAVLLDPSWTDSELRDAASQVELSLLLETDSTPARSEASAIFGVGSGELDPLGAIVKSCAGVPEGPLATGHQLQGPAIVYWSSGSTGRPKPIVLSEAALAVRLTALMERLELRSDDRTLCILPLSHCHGIECLALPTLFAGAELELVDPMSAEPGRTAHKIQNAKITFFSALPQFYDSLLKSDAEASALETVRIPMCGSAALDPDVARAIEKRFGVRIGLGYGLTEIGVICLNRHDQAPVRRDSVGPVLSGIEWRIHEPDAAGVGELWVRSAGCAPGSERLQDGWLRTEDLVRADADDYLFIRGRSSSFINVNGSKVDGNEIERLIEQLSWVRECAVAGVTDERGLERVVAYVVCARDRTIDRPREAIRLCVAESVSLYKVPSEVVLLSALPRGTLGKVLYAQLPLVPAQTPPQEPLLASGSLRNENERLVAAIWCDVLQLPSVGADDSFLELGGTSVLLAELSNRLHEQFGCDLTLSDLFRYPTVATLAEALGSGSSNTIVDEARDRARKQREALLEAQRKRLQ